MISSTTQHPRMAMRSSPNVNLFFIDYLSRVVGGQRSKVRYVTAPTRVKDSKRSTTIRITEGVIFGHSKTPLKMLILLVTLNTTKISEGIRHIFIASHANIIEKLSKLFTLLQVFFASINALGNNVRSTDIFRI